MPPQIYLKESRSAARKATEIAALTLIHAQPGGPPTPRLMDAGPETSSLILALSYEPGVNLADLLTPTPQAHPLPPWYKPTPVAVRPPTAELLPLLFELGQAVRALHTIRVQQFGKLLGDDPNPHRHNALAFTRQEINHYIQRGRELGSLPPAVETVVRAWIEPKLLCLRADEPPCLVHFDLHAANIRVDQNPHMGRWYLRCLYDFEMARGWLPEIDLVSIAWDLQHLEADHGEAWGSFVQGYGPIDPGRLALFEAARALLVIGYADRYSAGWQEFVMGRLRSLAMIGFPGLEAQGNRS